MRGIAALMEGTDYGGVSRPRKGLEVRFDDQPKLRTSFSAMAEQLLHLSPVTI
jgi:hypothetical protein